MSNQATRAAVGGQTTKTAPLIHFHRFPELPLEIRTLIWEATLTSRNVELSYDQSKGFCSLASTPTALQVDQDSRNIIARLYPPSFGNPMNPTKVRFHFQLDTLYISEDIQPDFMHLFAGFTPLEMNSLERIAISNEIIDGQMVDYHTYPSGHCIITALGNLLPRMPNLKTVYEVHDLSFEFDLDDYGHNLNENGTLGFYEEFPADFDLECDCFEDWHELQVFERDGFQFQDHDCWNVCYDLFSEAGGCNCYHDPQLSQSMLKLNGPNLKAIWGWKS